MNPEITDPRYSPKTLADCATEFRSMMESAIKQNEFEAAATCKSFLRAVEAAQVEIAKLRERVLRSQKAYLMNQGIPENEADKEAARFLGV